MTRAGVSLVVAAVLSCGCKVLPVTPPEVSGLAVLFPEQDADDTARKLDVLSQRIGLPLSLEALPVGEVAKPLPPQVQLARQYLQGELAKDRGPVGEPGPVLSLWLEVHEETLASINDLLLTSKPPQWRRRLGIPREQVIPGVAGQYWLAKLLLASSLTELSRGDRVKAEQRIEAAWRLAESVAGEPLVGLRSLGATTLAEQAAALRRLPSTSLAQRWEQRLAERDPHDGLAPTLQLAMDAEVQQVITECWSSSPCLPEGFEEGGSVDDDRWFVKRLHVSTAQARAQLALTRLVLTERAESWRGAAGGEHQPVDSCDDWRWEGATGEDGEVGFRWLGPVPPEDWALPLEHWESVR
ncbi:MAG: hypothetical protein AAF533_03220 [Acidobacteriota bacterium]